MDLAGVYGARVGVCAGAGETLTGTGTLRAYLYDPAVADWFYDPDLDLPIAKATPTGARGCRAWPDWVTGMRGGGRVLYAADGVGVSGGTTVNVYVSGQVTP